MVFRWLKQYMPRRLYARAALILILPVIFIQLLVSVVFIQRHFEGVTRQMSASVSIELRFISDVVDAAATRDAAMADARALAEPLEIAIAFPEAIPEIGNDRLWTDLTGDTVRSNLQETVPNLAEVSLADRRRVTTWLTTNKGPVELSFSRRRVSASNPHQLLVIMVVLGALMTLIAYFFLRNQLRPIKRMAAAAQAYGKGRVVNFTPTGAVEVRAAGTAFLDMRNRIERQTHSRTMMLSGVSHDLRTPLTRLKLGLSMLDAEDVAPLTKDVDEMQRLLDSFLDFARADAADTLEWIDPLDLLKDVIADAQRAGENVALGEVSGDSVPIQLRGTAVRRALVNLSSNALRYGTQAVIGMHITDRALRFVVEDDGPGIPPDRREEAQRPFARLDPARNQDHGSGVGLGLAIVSDIARGHGGHLRLGESDALGGLKAELILAK